MTNLYISPEVQNDLVEIQSYIAYDLTSPDAARNITEKITKRIKELKQFPEIGTNLSSIIEIETNYRFLVCGQYMVFYRYEEKQSVFVDRVLYGRCDYIKKLFGTNLETEI